MQEGKDMGRRSRVIEITRERTDRVTTNGSSESRAQHSAHIPYPTGIRCECGRQEFRGQSIYIYIYKYSIYV